MLQEQVKASQKNATPYIPLLNYKILQIYPEAND